ncbi:MAG: hypothetical protein GEV07_14310 [Streptosporangiales bacterium]|nr:hypothetical protein [Streptosporangiales bacterium]
MNDRYDRESSPGIPRWVKIAGIVALLVAVLVIVAMLIFGGDHGPRRHSGEPSFPIPSVEV